MPSSDFYVIGGTLQRSAKCYVARQADHDLYDSLKAGRLCYVLTSRQMGKSSLMVRTASRFREEQVSVVVLDLTAIGQNLSAEQWYDGLLSMVGEQLRLEDELEDFWAEHERLGPLQRWMLAIREVVLAHRPGQIVILIDEIDAVRSLPFSTDEFFAGIREFYNRRTEDPEMGRLTFALFGVATPSSLIRDTRTTPFNIGQRIELADFTEAQAEPLAQGLGYDEKTAQILIQRILYWTGGHPYLTQRLCQAVSLDGSVTGTAGVDRLCEELFLSSRAREKDDNLQFVRDRILRSEGDLAGLLDLYSQIRAKKHIRDDETNPLIDILRLAGIVKIRNGVLELRNRIYHRVFDQGWVLSNMPDAELRRQKAAFQRGVKRASTIALVILAIMGGLTAYALEQRREVRLQLLRHYEEQGRREWLDGRVDNALAYFNEVYSAGSNTPALRFLIRQCLNQVEKVQPRTLIGHNGFVQAARFSPDNRRIVSASADLTAKIWDVASGQELRTLTGHQDVVKSVAFSPDGKKIVTASFDGTAKVWDADSGQLLVTLSGHIGHVNSAAFSPDGSRIVTGGLDRTAKIWDTATGHLLHSIPGHQGSVNSALFHSGGSRILTASADQTARIWEVATGIQVVSFEGHRNAVNFAAFQPQGKLVVTASSDNTARLWEVESGREVGEFIGHRSLLNSAVFSPEGDFLVTTSVDRTACIWDAHTGGLLARLAQDRSPLTWAEFSPDRKWVLTGSQDELILLYRFEEETRKPAEIDRLVQEKVPVMMAGGRLVPNPKALAVNQPAPSSPAQERHPELMPATPGLPAPLQYQTFEVETVTLDEKGNVIARPKGQVRGYAEELAPGVKLEMVLLPGGTYLQGSPPHEKERGEEEPQHEVTVSGFAIGKFEVTQAQWEAVMGFNPSNFKGDNLPVEAVSWDEAVEFCARLTQKTGRLYRLPTESEWEYACRAGTTTPFAFGETVVSSVINDNGAYPYASAPKGENRRKTTPVGSFPPNAWGLYDMHGNVWEWCQDWNDEKYYLESPKVNPQGARKGTHRMVRGGSLGNIGVYCRSANRFIFAPGSRFSAFGLRVVSSGR
ncbi:MAG: SUMF1/EgtB/PvdO family nonheme iron enzyme [Blastocatellia bacterium]|nr:SUMF1/EgtB/PvdO family nonheme iron enzyme [Blastocatellia bacterium]